MRFTRLKKSIENDKLIGTNGSPFAKTSKKRVHVTPSPTEKTPDALKSMREVSPEVRKIHVKVEKEEDSASARGETQGRGKRVALGIDQDNSLEVDVTHDDDTSSTAYEDEGLYALNVSRPGSRHHSGSGEEDAPLAKRRDTSTVDDRSEAQNASERVQVVHATCDPDQSLPSGTRALPPDTVSGRQ